MIIGKKFIFEGTDFIESHFQKLLLSWPAIGVSQKWKKMLVCRKRIIVLRMGTYYYLRGGHLCFIISSFLCLSLCYRHTRHDTPLLVYKTIGIGLFFNFDHSEIFNFDRFWGNPKIKKFIFSPTLDFQKYLALTLLDIFSKANRKVTIRNRVGVK